MPLSSILSLCCSFPSSSQSPRNLHQLLHHLFSPSFSHLHPFSSKTKVSFCRRFPPPSSLRTETSFCNNIIPSSPHLTNKNIFHYSPSSFISAISSADSSSNNEGSNKDEDYNKQDEVDRKEGTHHVFTGFYDLKRVESLLDGINDFQTICKVETIYVGKIELNKKVYGLAETIVEMWLLSFSDYVFQVMHQMVTVEAHLNVDWIIRMRMESEKGFIVVSVNIDLTMEEINKQFDKLNDLGIRDFVWVIIPKFQDEGRPVVSKTSKVYYDIAQVTFKEGNGFHIVIYPEICLLQKYIVI